MNRVETSAKMDINGVLGGETTKMKNVADGLLALKLLPLCITLRAQTPIQLPRYKGSTLRGGFGTVFKETVCVVEYRDCTRCLLRTHCAYPYVFDTPIPNNTTRMRKYTMAPHPFVLLPPLENKTWWGTCRPQLVTLRVQRHGTARRRLPWRLWFARRR
jgi:hypothetical protein